MLVEDIFFLFLFSECSHWQIIIDSGGVWNARCAFLE